MVDAEAEAFRVFLRIRTLPQREGKARIDSDGTEASYIHEVQSGCKKVFDEVFGPDSTQSNIYDTAIEPLVSSFLGGKSCNVLLYGESRAGKTYSLLGSLQKIMMTPAAPQQANINDSANEMERRNGSSLQYHQGLNERARSIEGICDSSYSDMKDTGMLPRIMHDIFSTNVGQDLLKSNSNLHIKCSFTMIYQEKIVDLLATADMDTSKKRNEKNSLRFLKLKDDSDVYVDGVTEKICHSEEDFIYIMQCAIDRQRLLQTHYGAVSSWSNLLFTMKLVQRVSPSESKVLSYMNLVDLADCTLSSKLKKSTSDKEQKLRKAYSAVSNMIITKAQSCKKARHHDSKLTRLLYPQMHHTADNVLFLCVKPGRKRSRRTKEIISMGLVAKRFKGISPQACDESDRGIRRMDDECPVSVKDEPQQQILGRNVALRRSSSDINEEVIGDKESCKELVSNRRKRGGGVPVKVYLRLRPLNRFEKSRRCHSCINLDESNRSKAFVDSPINGQVTVEFDHTFDVDTSLDDIHRYFGKNFVEGILKMKCNHALIAYGLSQTGKTSTLFGHMNRRNVFEEDAVGEITEEQDGGLSNRIMNDLLSARSEMKDAGYELTLRLSFVAVLLETTWDLLRDYNIVDLSSEKIIDEKSITEVTLNDTSTFFALGKDGFNRLHALCDQLSISPDLGHLFMTIRIEKKSMMTKSIERGKLQIVKLGGFQGNSMTFKPKMAQQIHSAHRSFKGIIKAVVKGDQTIPYEKSKVTSMLQDAIGGSCNTCVIMTASPSTHNISETIQSMILGQSIRKVLNYPGANVFSPSSKGCDSDVFNRDNPSHCHNHDQIVHAIQTELEKAKKDNKSLTDHKLSLEAEIDGLKRKELQTNIVGLDLKQKLGSMEYKARSCSVYLNHLRKLHWQLQLEVANKSSEEYKSDLAEFFTQYPDISGITDFDDVLLDAGLIEDVERKEGVLEGDVDVLIQEGKSLKLADLKVKELLDLEDLSDSCDSRCNDGAPTSESLSPRERQLMKELRAMSSKCRDLQNRLDTERANVNTLKNGNSIIFQSRLVHEILVLREEHELYVKNSRVAAWKLHEVDSVNKALQEKLAVTTNHLTLLEDAFQNLQSNYCSSVTEAHEREQQLIKKLRQSELNT